MPVTDSFLEFVLEQLDPVGPMTSKRMFGGVGLYAGDLFFGLLSRDVLYLKTDESNRGMMKKAGARAFEPYPGQGKGKMQYFSVPAAILEDNEELIAWATKSVAVARTQRLSPKPKGSRSRKVSKPR